MGYSPQGHKELDTTEQLHFFTSPILVFLGFPCDSTGKESTGNAEELGSIPGLKGSPVEGNGTSLQYSCLENPMEGGAW